MIMPPWNKILKSTHCCISMINFSSVSVHPPWNQHSILQGWNGIWLSCWEGVQKVIFSFMECILYKFALWTGSLGIRLGQWFKGPNLWRILSSQGKILIWSWVSIPEGHCCGWWKKSCTSWYGWYPIIYIPGGAGFLPSTVSLLSWVLIPKSTHSLPFARRILSSKRPEACGTRTEAQFVTASKPAICQVWQGQ